MTHDLLGVLKIALVVVLSALVLGGIAAFYDGRRAGQRTFWLVLGASSLVGMLQVVKVSHLAWALLGYALVLSGGLLWWRRRAR